MASRSLYEHIASNEDVARYTAHAQRLLRYQRHLEAVLPPVLRSHSRIANVRDGKLVIFASNASVAAKVRQCAPRLAGIFAAEGMKLSEIEVKVQPTTQTGGAPVSTPRASPGVAQQQALAQLLAKLPEDSRLRTPLEGLLAAIKSRSVARQA